MSALINELGNAIADCDSSRVRAMLKKHPETVNGYDEDGRTLLIIALDLGYENMVELVLEHGANPDQCDKEGRLPLVIAMDYDSEPILGPLLRHKVNVEYRAAQTGYTYLDIAYEKKAFTSARLLIRYGAEIEQAALFPDNQFQQWVQRDALALYAAAHGKQDELKAVLDQGVDPNTTSADDRLFRAQHSLLMLAVDNENESTVKLLLSCGANPQVRNHYGETPLHRAASSGAENIASILLEHGADVNATNEWGHTPLMMAAMRSNVEMGKLLRRAGASSNTQDRSAKNASDYCQETEKSYRKYP